MKTMTTLIALCMALTMQANAAPYDSTRAFPGVGDIYTLIGQYVMVKPLPFECRSEGYPGFRTPDFTPDCSEDDHSHVLYPASDDMYETMSDHSKLAYGTYLVTDVTEYGDNPLWPEFILTLQDRDNPDMTCKYVCHIREPWRIHLIAVSHIMYAANRYVGCEMVITEPVESYDARTSECTEQDILTGRWYCIDIDFDDETGELAMSLISENGERTAQTSLERADCFIRQRKFTDNEWIELCSRYGEDRMELAAHGSVTTGMDEHLLYVAWGLPDRIVRHGNGLSVYEYGSVTVNVIDGKVDNCPDD